MSAEIQHLYPLSRLFIGSEKTVVVCGSQIFTLDSQSGAQLATTTVSSTEKNVSSIVRVASVDSSYQRLITSGEDKRLRVWSIHDLKELSCREIPKRANVLRLTQDGQTILVADKFGDIFSYPLEAPEPKPAPETQAADGSSSGSKFVSLAMHDNPEGTLVLGHASIVTDFILTPDEKLVISADRDEHVRVSWYPEGWDVERYCMGHKKFVTALEIPSCSPSTLISGGGDLELYVWNFREGRALGRIPVWEHIRPFLKVKGGRRKKETWEGKKAPKGKKKKAKAATGDKAPAEEDPTMETSADKPESTDEEVLVVSQIKYTRLGDHDIVLFSAIGSSALFYFEWPTSLDFTKVAVRSLDLHNPVTEFAVVEGETIWISVDPSWPAVPGATESTGAIDPRRIRRVIWKDGELIEEESGLSLAQSLNEGCIVKGPTSEIQALNLYDPLISLPKNAEWDGADGGGEESGTPISSDITSGPGLRASARQKNKEQLEKRKALTQEATQRAAKQPRVEET